MTETQHPYLIGINRQAEASDNEHIKSLARSVIDLANEVDHLNSVNAKLSNALALILEYLEDKAPLNMTYHEMIEAARAALREAS